MDSATLITAFVALFVVIDPIGLTPLFVALTHGMSAAARRRIALRACAVAIALLTLFGVLGDKVLGFVGISMAAFQISGGVLLFLTALDMLFDRRGKRRQGQVNEDDPANDPSVFPLAMPLIAGPGAMATMVLLAGAPDTSWAELLEVHLVMAGVITAVFTMFLSAGLLERVLGPTGINVITRLLGMLLAALSVQFILDGLAGSGLGTG